MKDIEIWKPIKGFEKSYQISSFGRIKSNTRFVVHSMRHDKTFIRLRKSRMIKFGTHEFGYPQVTLQQEGRILYSSVHRLVLENFVGPKPKGYQCSHLDGNPKNNNIDNLKWESPSDNNKRKKDHKTWQGGSKNGNAKLCEESVRNIKLLRLNEKLTHKQLSELYNVGKSNIKKILSGRAWKHVTIYDDKKGTGATEGE